jgi:hypothetical protein
VLEFTVFVAMAFCFYLVCVGRHAWMRRRERQRERMVARTVRAFVGSRVEAATKTLGPPAGVFEGTTGRSLYIWRPPREGAIPGGDGMVLVSMVVSADGAVADATWRIIREPATL